MDEFDRLMEIQRMTASSIRRESEVDNTIRVLDILNALTKRPGQRIQVEEVIIEAGNQGMGEAEVMRVLDSLQKDGMIKSPQDGYVQII